MISGRKEDKYLPHVCWLLEAQFEDDHDHLNEHNNSK